MKARANSIEMNYDITGTSRDIITLLHGSGDNMGAWWPQVPAFAKKYRVLRYDVRGHGQTETPESDIDPKVWVEDLFQLLRNLGIQRTYLMGYSMGAGIAVEFATAHRGMAAAVIMANGGIPGLTRLSEEEQKAMDERHAAQVATLRSHGMAGLVEDRVKMIFSPGFAERNPTTVERYKALFLQNDPMSYLKVLEAAPKRTKLDLRNIMGKDPLPILIIAGEHDAFFGPEAAEKVKQVIPGAELRTLPTGHAANLEAPEEFNRIVMDFLEDVEFLADTISMQGRW